MIEWIVTSSALILLVLLLRLLVRDRVSPRLRYALWGLVLLRLVIPMSLWESPASVLRAAQVNEAISWSAPCRTICPCMRMAAGDLWRVQTAPSRWSLTQPEGGK